MKVRELFVPFEDLNVLLESGPQRVLLSRTEYEELLAKARKTAERRPPLAAALVSAEYAVTAAPERAEIAGTIIVNVLEDGLHAVGLDVAGVGLRAATLDGKGAPIGLADDGRLTVFVEGKGQHQLVLQMVAPLQTTAATQVLNFRLPTPAATRMHLAVPGDVEVKSGAAVAARTFDEAAGLTRIELLPPRADVSLVMSLNSRLKRKDRVVVARGVLVDEITQAYERLHATVSLAILHRATDLFRFALPPGFEVTTVESPLLAQWRIAAEAGGANVLEVQLREETTERVVLTISALRTSPNLEAWSLPRFDPLDVAGYAAVVGLVVEDRLKAESLAPQGLICIDTAVLAQAMPATVLEAEAGAARIRPVVAYYAPQDKFGLTARFVKPPAKVLVTTNLLLALEDGGEQVRGGFALLPEAEKLFGFDFSVPAGWDVSDVTGEKGEKIAFERYEAADKAGRIHVRLPAGVAAGVEQRVYFQAVHVPKEWFTDWTAAAADFPVFAVSGASRDVGAVAVDARDDMTVRPESLQRLTPLDENEKAKYGLAGVAAALAWRYDAQPYQARLAVERTRPRLTAKTYSFFRIEQGAITAHYELVYDVTEARTRRLALVLPKDTPAALSIRGLDGLALKEYTSEMVGETASGSRRWTAILADARKGTLRLAVDFEQRASAADARELALPVVRADGAAYQSGLVAVEGSAECDVRVDTKARRVDIGELVDASYQPGRRLLGAYGFLGDPAAVKVTVARNPAYGLPPAIVQRGELATVLSADGIAQTAARFLLRTKALFLEVRLPKGSTLWAASLDGNPAKPQREGDSLLLNLPAGGEGTVRDLQVVYQAGAGRLGFWTGVEAYAPRLFLHAGPAAEGQEVPVADLLWQVYLPTGYQVVRSEGSVVTEEVQPPELAAASLAGALWYTSGGVDFDTGLLGLTCVFSSGLPRVQYVMGRADHARKHAEEAPSPAAEPLSETIAAPARPHMGVDAGAKLEAYKLAEVEANKPVAGPVTGKPGGETIAVNGAVVRLEGGNTYAGGTVIPTTPAAPPPVPPQEKPQQVQKTPAKAKSSWALEGVSSLRIDLQPGGEPVTFRSLGAEPRLGLVVADLARLDSLAWGLALAILVLGMALTTQPVGRKAAYVVGVALVATLIPVITARIELAMAVNGAFYAACLLIPYYLLAGAARWMARKVRGVLRPEAAGGAAAVLVLAAAVLAGGAMAAADEPAGPYVVQIVPPGPPVKVPEDAIILPYDPASKTGIKDADRLLVPYEKYVELWNQAYPEKPIGARPPPAPYALAGGAFSASLAGDEFLLLEGYIDIDVYTDGYALVPLPLDGGVLARADLDGKPARLSVTQVEAAAMPGAKGGKAGKAAVEAAPPPLPRSFVVLYATGKGRHRLDLAVRMRLEKRGGWRVAEGRLPAAPATALALKVPDAGTEVRLGGVLDRRAYDTKAPGESIATALGADGALSVQWRPKVTEGQLDQTLTAESVADLDVQEDQLRLRWALALEFRHGEREFFTIEVPEGYLVEKVEGTNVRGWELKPSGARQELEVTLLGRSKEKESLAVTLWRPSALAGAGPVAFDVPLVGVAGAMRHSGRLTIRRSPLLDLRTVSTAGVTRIDLAAEPRAAGAETRRASSEPAPRAAGGTGVSPVNPGQRLRPEAGATGGDADDESPLGIRPYQAYQFVSVPFTVRLEAAPVAGRTSAVVQTVLKVAERERTIESRVLLTVEDRPLYRARFAVPADLRLDRVQAPGAFEWALTDEGGRKVLTVYLAAGALGQAAILIQGKLGEDSPALALDLPQLAVLDVERQEGDIVVQVDPAFEIRGEGLKNVERVLLERVFGWLAEGQRTLAQLALHYTQPDYAGRLALAARKADVACFTVTNSRVTDRAIQDAVLIDWSIKNAGVREVSFLLPGWMKDARVSVPLLRQKTVTPTAAEPGSPVRVRLELQDEVMDDLRVLVENDRLLTDRSHEAPIPVVETGRTDRRYVAVESAGRDEVEVVRQEGLEPLGRQQKEWAAVARLLRGGMTQAFIVAAGAGRPQLAFRTKERAAVETAGARIGLAQAVLVFDSSGAYRAEQVYRVDNRTEQFLEVQMPEGSVLWTATVAGEPVKPTVLSDPSRPGCVRVPIVKTAAGDRDYAVVLKYAGKATALEGLRATVGFPLIRTANISVELSQVTLYLPETLEWFYFRGSAHRVIEEGELAAGILSYQTKQAEGLLQTLRFGNPFERARAAANLGSLSQELRWSQSDFSAYESNKEVQAQSSNATVIIESAGKEIAQAQQGAAAVQMDNNSSLRDAYADQRNNRARNIVNDLGYNWKEGQATAGAGTTVTVGGSGQFNAGWLAANRLENPAQVEDRTKALEGGKAGKEAKQRLDLGGGNLYFNQPGAPQMNQPAAPQVGNQAALSIQQQRQAGEQGRPAAQQAAEQQQGKDNVQQMAQRYQQRLEQQAVQQGRGGRAGGGGGAGGGAPRFEVSTVETRRGRAGAGLFGGVGGVADEGVVPAEAGVPTGMASLDVELPLRGKKYEFTTPGGKLEIRASAASLPLISGLERLGGVAVLVILVLAARWLVRGRSFGLSAQRTASTVLLALGLLGILFGVFPLAGLAALVVGVIMKVRLRSARRRQVAAA